MIKEISVKLPEQFLITKTTISFEKNFYQLSMKNRFEAAKFETDPKFKNTIIDIKYNHLKSIAFTTTNPSAIIIFDKKIDPICTNNSSEAEKLEPEPTFEKTIIDIEDNDLKSVVSAAINP